MKIKLLFISALALFFVSCSSSINSSLSFDFLSAFLSGFGENQSLSENWKISPETTVKTFVQSMADGNCDEAQKLTIGIAKEHVQASINTGCDPYETSILSVSCDVQEKAARCTCAETRSGLNMIYNYDLVLSKKKWKIENYEKDLSATN